jgi:hypothetical protein
MAMVSLRIVHLYVCVAHFDMRFIRSVFVKGGPSTLQ